MQVPLKVFLGFIGWVVLHQLFKKLVQAVSQEQSKTGATLTTPPPLPRRKLARSTKKISTVPTIVPKVMKSTPKPVAKSEPVVVEPLKLMTVLPATKTKVIHPWFAGREAMRRSMVTREVLGPPVALRPPRY
jgi:hypothetical protein